jgi:2-polyprenyl-3-methyl-5-hydroxy-6-metoxy-1,4-benzoquinol methylase
MSGSATYDGIASYYTSFVEQNLADKQSVLATATRSLIDTVGDVAGLEICDLGCGEGHLSRWFAQRAKSVVGIDLSADLLALARKKLSQITSILS